jgi:hypothetical protein
MWAKYELKRLVTPRVVPSLVIRSSIKPKNLRSSHSMHASILFLLPLEPAERLD